MTYRLLDWLACSECRSFPLLPTDLTQRAATRSPSPVSSVQCESHCGRQQVRPSEVKPGDCAGCADIEVTEAQIECPRCRAAFRVTDGIPDMIPRDLAKAARQAEAPPASRGLHDKAREIRARDRQAETYDSRRHPFSKHVELSAILRHLTVRRGDRILDGGAGTGYVTLPCLRSGAEVLATDFSRQSLSILQRAARASALPPAHLVQADLCRLPLRNGIFDKAAQAQVLEHLPTPEDRDSALAETRRVLKPQGNFVLSVYNSSVWKKRAAARGETDYAQREGYHGGEIYYRNFRAQELRSLLSQYFQVRSIYGVLNQLPRDLEFRSGRVGFWVEKALQMTPLSRLLGRLLVAECWREP